MNGILGKPYKFFYSARGYVSGLVNIIALVKKPDGSAFGTFSLDELSGSLFLGTYSFDLPTVQNDPEGEYSVVIYEQTSLHRENSKVSLYLPTSDSSQIQEPELFGVIEDSVIHGSISQNSVLSSVISESRLNAKVETGTMLASIDQNSLSAVISEEQLNAKITECP